MEIEFPWKDGQVFYPNIPWLNIYDDDVWIGKKIIAIRTVKGAVEVYDLREFDREDTTCSKCRGSGKKSIVVPDQAADWILW